jgi:hypothetical protein
MLDQIEQAPVRRAYADDLRCCLVQMTSTRRPSYARPVMSIADPTVAKRKAAAQSMALSQRSVCIFCCQFEHVCMKRREAERVFSFKNDENQISGSYRRILEENIHTIFEKEFACLNF